VVIPDLDIRTFNVSFSFAPILYPSIIDSGGAPELVSLYRYILLVAAIPTIFFTSKARNSVPVSVLLLTLGGII